MTCVVGDALLAETVRSPLIIQQTVGIAGLKP